MFICAWWVSVPICDIGRESVPGPTNVARTPTLAGVVPGASGLRLDQVNTSAEDGLWPRSPRRPDATWYPERALRAWLLLGISALTGLTVWGQASSGGSTGVLVLAVVVGVISCALVPVTLRWPVAGAAALSVLAALSPAATPAATVAVLLVAQRRRFAVALAVAGAGAVAHAIRGAWQPITGLPYGWWPVLVVVAYAALVGWGALSQASRGPGGAGGTQPARTRGGSGHWAGSDQCRDRADLAMSVPTVKAHITHVLTKLGLTNRTQIALLVHDAGLA